MQDNLTWVSRNEPYLSGSPQFTPWEENSKHLVEHDGNVTITDRIRDSEVPSRPAQRRVVFFLQPVADGDGDIGWTDWVGAGGFITGKSITRMEVGEPRGRFMLDDQRRNIARPPTISYGDLVGEMDGYSSEHEEEELLS